MGESKMKLGIIGASGKSGSLIMKEALERGHDVTAIVRNRDKVSNKNVCILEKNIFDLTTDDLKEFDVVVNAFNTAPGEEEGHLTAGKILIDALNGTPNTKLFVVGGAGSLYVDDSMKLQLVNTPDFPELYYATASSMAKNLDELRKVDSFTWTFLSPAIFFDPEGPRTGKYRLASEILTMDSNGNSYISYADYAIAVIDEIENPKHENKRFSVLS
jgi:putative NADH-flavin reductase